MQPCAAVARSHNSAPRRFLFVDGLRGVAALWVVFFHALEGAHIDSLVAALPQSLVTVIFKWGHFGVAIFFVLSGFVIAHSLRDATVTPSYLGRFMLRRSIRLDPPYFLSIILVLAFAYVSATVKREVTPWPTLSQLGAHALYVQGLCGIEQINDAYWTLCYEIQFYLVLCVLIGMSQCIGSHGTAMVFLPAGAVSLLWALGFWSDNIAPGLFTNLWYGFLLGVFCYWAWNRTIPTPWFFVYAFTILISAIVRQNGFAITCSTVALLLFAAARLNQLENWLCWRWLQFLGLVSYSLYLIHNPITGASFYVMKKQLGKSAASEGWMLVMAVVGCIALAYLMTRLIERPFLQLARTVSLTAERPKSR